MPNEEPNFAISEKEQFKIYRVKDGDGFVDIGEVRLRRIFHFNNL